MGWTEERIERLKTLWARGESATFIAETFGDVTRNGVIGKVHRLGLPYRKTQVRTRCSQVAWARPLELVRSAKWKSDRAKATADIKPKQANKPGPAPTPQVSRSTETPAIEKLKAMASIMRETDKPTGRLGLLDLEPHHCRWPIGMPEDEDFHFCGERKMRGISYCEAHALIAFQPAPRRKPRTDPIPMPKGIAA